MLDEIADTSSLRSDRAVTYRPEKQRPRSGASTADPVTTEIIRHGLSAAADQMQVALRRTAFSPIIYEIRDLSCTLYDRDLRLLAQDKSLPSWAGTMNFSIEAILKRIGGVEKLAPGDVLFSTYGYDLGSHPPDGITVTPIFVSSELIGYAAVKAHQMDIGAKDFYCSDTTDNFQEGTIFPGVFLYKAGERQEDMWRTLAANSRMPKALIGDVTASIAAAEVGSRAMKRLVAKYGIVRFFDCVECMFDHGEATMRRLLADIPRGRYVAHGSLDSNGVTEDPLEFNIVIEVTSDEILVDFTDAPIQQRAPINAPQQVAVSCARYTMMFLAGGDSRDQLNEGHLRPIAIRTCPGTLFHPKPPAPIFLYNHPSRQACDAIIRSLSDVLPNKVRADSGGCLVPTTVWGLGADGGFAWATGINHPIGQGASCHSDGGAPLFHVAISGVRNAPTEVLEARFPLRVRKTELAQDSAGAGEYAGGPGLDIEYEFLADSYYTVIIERTKRKSLGLFGGQAGRANHMRITSPDGAQRDVAKVTALPVKRGSRVEIRTGGGGGYGPPEKRDLALIEKDIRQELLSRERAVMSYPQYARKIQKEGA